MINKVKRIIIFIVILVVILGICAIILNLKGNNSGDKATKIAELQDIKQLYNIEKLINSGLKLTYDVKDNKMGLDDIEVKNTYEKFLKKININKENKDFHIRKAFNIELNDKYTLYFVEGYLLRQDIFDVTDTNEKKQNVKFTLIKDNEKKTCNLEIYGDNYTDIFRYNDDIIKTEISTKNIKKLEGNNEILIGSNVLDVDTREGDIAYWLYKDIKLNILYFPYDAYNLLENDYKNDQFSNSSEKFVEYFKKNSNRLREGALLKYAVDNEKNYTLYTLADSNNTYYVKINNNLSDYKLKIEDR